MIKIGICGFGNLGRGVAAAVKNVVIWSLLAFLQEGILRH